MPIAPYGGSYYDRFRADGTVVPWHLTSVNEQLEKDGLAPLDVDLT